MPATADGAGFRPLRLLVEVLAVAVAAFALGGLTSVAQGALPDVLGPLANSSTAWTLLAVALAAGALAGVATGEGAYGLLVVSATTGWVVWAGSAVLGVALLAVVSRRLASRRTAALAAGVTVIVAVAFLLAYRFAGSLPL